MVAVVAGALISAAFGQEHAPPSSATIGQEATATSPPATPPASVDDATPTATTPAPTQADLTGFAYPIEGGCLPASDDLMPGAPRTYRRSTHEGVDFYDSDNCTPIGEGTDVHAAKAGTVIRADWEYIGLTEDTLAKLLDRARHGDAKDPDLEDTFRGRQVWVDHGDGVVTRYAHLSAAADGIEVGDHVQQGELIAYVGDTGTPESVTNPGTEMHLHFEIRAGAEYLGQGDQPDDLRLLYQRAFGVTP